jgi:hypothetical protein
MKRSHIETKEAIEEHRRNIIIDKFDPTTGTLYISSNVKKIEFGSKTVEINTSGSSTVTLTTTLIKYPVTTNDVLNKKQLLCDEVKKFDLDTNPSDKNSVIKPVKKKYYYKNKKKKPTDTNKNNKV